MFGKMISSAVLAASVSLGGIAAAAAAPVIQQPVAEAGSLATNVDYRRHPKMERRGDNYYFNGHRGYRHERPGYRYYNGFWFPAAAFTLGLLLAPQIQQGQVIHLTPAHYRWCENRYRSYHRWDNSFQPYHGPRQQCVSPYMYR